MSLLLNSNLAVWLAPPVLLLLAGLLMLFCKPILRPWLILLASAAALYCVWQPVWAVVLDWQILHHELLPFVTDPLSRVFATAFCVAIALGGLYACGRGVGRNELVPALCYAAAALGVVHAGDWLSLLVWWEILAIASTLIIWAAGPAAKAASFRYLMIHLFGGFVLMAGIAGRAQAGESLLLGVITPTHWYDWWMLIGILINAGAPPLWSWLADAYPAASPSGSVFLSAFTTKAAVYVLLRCFPGVDLLIGLGLAMAVYGVIYAMRENHMRRLLVYSLVGQVGFMLVAIGSGHPLALAGAALHAFCHIMYKALLLMTAGRLEDQSGMALLTQQVASDKRQLTWLALAAFIGGLSLAAAPLTSGYVSKTLMLKGLAEGHQTIAWFGLLAVSAAALMYVGLRYPWFAFVARHEAAQILEQSTSPAKPLEQGLSSTVAIALATGLCLFIGCYPTLLTGLLPETQSIAVYTIDHVISQLQLLAVSALLFCLFYRHLLANSGRSLDFDWLWRAPVPAIKAFANQCSVRYAGLTTVANQAKHFAGEQLKNNFGPTSASARTRSSGTMLLFALGFLSVCLGLYFAT